MKAKGLKRVLICLLGLLFLSGCGTSYKLSKQDGPPRHIPKNLHKIPNAVPKVEPLSRSGNRYGKSKFHNSYVAHKKRHHVMKTSRGYKERGTASWYGTRFHGRKMANGEHYDMFAMVAAHKTLPLPTYVKVTNLRNGKSVIVRVADRGPFTHNRLIDLSYAAAAKLGILGHGTAHVEVVSVDPRDHQHSHKHRHAPHKAPLTPRCAVPFVDKSRPRPSRGEGKTPPKKPPVQRKTPQKVKKPPVQRRR